MRGDMSDMGDMADDGQDMSDIGDMADDGQARRANLVRVSLRPQWADSKCSSSYLCESLLQVQIKKTMLMTDFDILGDQDSLVGSDLA